MAHLMHSLVERLLRYSSIQTTQVSPYSTARSPLASIKVDVDRIKRLSLAYQNEDTWNPLGNLGPASSSASVLEELISSYLRRCNSVEPSLLLA